MTAPVLADACALLDFFAGGGATMTEAGVAAMQGEVAVSPITVWELTRKAALGKLPPLPMANGSFAGWLANQGFRIQSLAWVDSERANALPPFHKDPIDRMLIAQALNTGITVITNDALYARYGVRTVW